MKIGKIASNFKSFEKQRHPFKTRRLQKCWNFKTIETLWSIRLVEYYKETSKILVILPWKEVADPVPPTPRTDCKIKQLCQKATIHFFIRNKKIYAKSWLVWRQEQLEIVCTKILNFLPANLWRNPWLHQEWPSKGLNFCCHYKGLDKRRLAESDVFWRIHLLTVCFLQTLRLQTTWIFTSELTVPPTNR